MAASTIHIHPRRKNIATADNGAIAKSSCKSKYFWLWLCRADPKLADHVFFARHETVGVVKCHILLVLLMHAFGEVWHRKIEDADQLLDIHSTSLGQLHWNESTRRKDGNSDFGRLIQFFVVRVCTQFTTTKAEGEEERGENVCLFRDLCIKRLIRACLHYLN